MMTVLTDETSMKLYDIELATSWSNFCDFPSGQWKRSSNPSGCRFAVAQPQGAFLPPEDRHPFH